MEINDLLNDNARICVFVNLQDLREIIKDMVSEFRPVSAEPEPEKYLSRKEVLHILQIESSTLWGWEKTGYITSYPFGGRKRYKAVDVEEIRTGRRGRRYQG